MAESKLPDCIGIGTIKDSYVVVLILIIGSLVNLLFLQTVTDFWFDDDATLYAFVSGVGDPSAFFLSQKVLSASGFSFTPVQMLSYWFDLKFGGIDPQVAYIHSSISFLLTSVMLFRIMRFSESIFFSLVITVFWMILPSTIVVQEFIGTRHYMEGFLLMLCSVYFCIINTSVVTPSQRTIVTFFSLSFLFCAMLCKEIYVTAGPTFLFLIFLYKRRFWEAGSVIGVSALYALYRLWAIGLSSKYPTPGFDLENYLEFVVKLPYIFTGNYGGYFLLACVFLYGVYLVLKKRYSLVAIVFFALLIVLSLATIYSGSSYLSADWQSRGTWYRLVFLLNSLILIGGALIFRSSDHTCAKIVFLLLFISLVHGAYITRNHWNTLKDRYAKMGLFYIEHDEKIVYSEVPAYWYLGGIKKLYGLKHPYILSHSPKNFKYDQSEDIHEVWRYKNGEMVGDKELWQKLKSKFSTTDR